MRPTLLLPLTLLAAAAHAGFPLEALGPYGPELVQTALGLQRHTEWVSAEDQQTAREAMGKHGFRMIGPWIEAMPHLRAYVAFRKEPNEVVVAFRGTKGDNVGQTVLNGIVDAQSLIQRPVPFLPAGEGPEAKIHSGFRKAYERVREQVRAKVAQRLERRPGARIYVAGHSLGAAMATLCALDLDYRHGGEVQLFASGCPRVGNGAFAELVERRLPNLLRVSVKGDPIPGVPTGRKYDHAGRLLFLDADGTRLPASDLKKPAVRMKARHGREVYYQALRDHRGKISGEPGVLREAARVQDSKLVGARGESNAAIAGEKTRTAAGKVRDAAGKVRERLRRKR
jgi:hypothetical protein